MKYLARIIALIALRRVIKKLFKDSLPAQKSGLDYVPYDGFIERLHKGKTVLTAEEVKKYKSR